MLGTMSTARGRRCSALSHGQGQAYCSHLTVGGEPRWSLTLKPMWVPQSGAAYGGDYKGHLEKWGATPNVHWNLFHYFTAIYIYICSHFMPKKGHSLSSLGQVVRSQDRERHM